MDPSKTFPLSAKPRNTITSDHAGNVQVIHTSIAGISHEIPGVSQIYVQYTPNSSWINALSEKHILGFLLHAATATKRLYIIANKSGNCTLIKRGGIFDIPEPKDDDCLVGIYAALNDQNRGDKFNISLKNRANILREALGDFTR